MAATMKKTFHESNFHCYLGVSYVPGHNKDVKNKYLVTYALFLTYYLYKESLKHVGISKNIFPSISPHLLCALFPDIWRQNLERKNRYFLK